MSRENREITSYGRCEKGKLLMVRREQFMAALANWPDCEFEIVVRRIGKPRTTKQNAYYHGVVVVLIRDAINEVQGERFTSADIHEWLKVKFNHIDVMNDSGEVITIPKSTATLNTQEFADYIELCRQWAWEFLTLDIPDPERDRALPLPLPPLPEFLQQSYNQIES